VTAAAVHSRARVAARAERRFVFEAREHRHEFLDFRLGTQGGEGRWRRGRVAFVEPVALRFRRDALSPCGSPSPAGDAIAGSGRGSSTTGGWAGAAG
jgi:hypothetical protein